MHKDMQNVQFTYYFLMPIIRNYRYYSSMNSISGIKLAMKEAP